MLFIFIFSIPNLPVAGSITVKASVWDISIIGLGGYVQYDIHMTVMILVRITKKLPRPCGGYSQEFRE